MRHYKVASTALTKRRFLEQTPPFCTLRTVPGCINSDTTILPPLAVLLTMGGDRRISVNPSTGRNKYGCSAFPEPSALAYGSSTASTVSVNGFAAAERLRQRLMATSRFEAPLVTYTREVARIRTELLHLLGISDAAGVEVVIDASGTDLFYSAVQLVGNDSHLVVILIDSSELGSLVPKALIGKHLCEYQDEARRLKAGAPCDRVQIRTVPVRMGDGTPRSAADIDLEVEALVSTATSRDWRVLLVLTDVSKTGLLAPSPALALDLRRRFPSSVCLLVDACQLRLAPSTVHAYLENNFLVAITGSKFVTGPSFSGALLVPNESTRRSRLRGFSSTLAGGLSPSDGARCWTGPSIPLETTNIGLLVRWEAALEEFRNFRSLPEASVTQFFKVFAQAVNRRLSSDSALEPLAVPALTRWPLADSSSWDREQTIFPFLLRHPKSRDRLISVLETTAVYESLMTDPGDKPHLVSTNGALITERCHVGQPVACGSRHGIPFAALRMCMSMRLAVDAISPQGCGPEAVISGALRVLDKAALLASSVRA
jgi:hypothetical protein